MVARGFGGRYFSLQAITATVSFVALQKFAASVRAYRVYQRSQKESDPPPDEEIANSSKPCFCNIFFACLAHNILRHSRIHKPPLCRCRYTKTGIAPPTN